MILPHPQARKNKQNSENSENALFLKQKTVKVPGRNKQKLQKTVKACFLDVSARRGGKK